jgi:hypothetical protein
MNLFYDIIITLFVCLTFIIIFLVLFKIFIFNNKALLDEITKVTSDKSKIKSNYKELSIEDTGKIIMELKKINFYPSMLIEFECGKCKNMALFVAKGIPKAKGYESNKNIKKGLDILKKLPQSISKNITIEEIDLEKVELNEKTLIIINNDNYTDELNNKLFDKFKSKDVVFIIRKLPSEIDNMNIIQKTDNYIMLNY